VNLYPRSGHKHGHGHDLGLCISPRHDVITQTLVALSSFSYINIFEYPKLSIHPLIMKCHRIHVKTGKRTLTYDAAILGLHLPPPPGPPMCPCRSDQEILTSSSTQTSTNTHGPSWESEGPRQAGPKDGC
jgi:hypothetical protein